ncbi:MAG: serine/threonine protein kinase [Proteobacteria bacterium]|nr:serine/threonine protein kinase [Pseudomonadota bacterium]
MESLKPANITPTGHEYTQSSNRKDLTKKIIAGKYEILQEIGHGAQGKVFAAKIIETGEIVVVKRLSIASIKTWKEYELFHREADVLRTLNIDGVAGFYDAIECLDDNPPCSYIVREYIDGRSLQNLISEGYRFSVEIVYDILIQTLQILDKLHHHDPVVIHRDIKPSNLMLTPKQDGFKVTIIDFGAVANPQLQGGGSTVAGTYGYMPPEQLMGNPVAASDIYALAALAVQLFSGIAPCDIPVKDFRLIFEPLMQDKPHALVSLLRQMLKPKADNRFADIPAIIKQLQQLKSGEDALAIASDQTIYNRKFEYNKKFEQKLAAVQSICEPGTMDIWQKLPDKNNRAVPKKYKDFYNSYCNPQGLRLVWRTIRKIWFAGWSAIIGCIVFLLLLAVLVGFYYLFIKFVNFLTDFLTDFMALFLLAATGVGFGFCLRVAYLCGKKVFSRISDRRIDNYAVKKAIRLISNSRKDIATITDITYMPVSSERCEMHGVSKQDDDHRQVYEIKDILPKFRVRYKFRVSDSRRSEEIVHEYITHVNPEDHYKPGDPLPILYQIENNEFYDTVQSMPFPIPIDDLDDNDTIVSQSSSLSHDVAQIPDSDLAYSGEKNVDSWLRILDKHESNTLVDAALGLIYDHRGDLLAMNSDVLAMVFCRIDRILRDERFAHCHSRCVQILRYYAVNGSEQSEYNCSHKAMALIRQYLYHQPRTPLLPDYRAIQVIMDMVPNAIEQNHPELLNDDYYSGLSEVMCDPDVSEKVVKKLSSWDWPEAPDYIVKCVYDKLNAMHYGDHEKLKWIEPIRHRFFTMQSFDNQPG